MKSSEFMGDKHAEDILAVFFIPEIWNLLLKVHIS